MGRKKYAIIGILILLGFVLTSYLSSLSFAPDALAGKAVFTHSLSVVLDQGNIALFFCPRDNCEQTLVQFLQSAEESIHCALYDIGLASVQESLLEKSKSIEVQVVTDSDYAQKFNASFVKADEWGLMHNKFCIIDGMKVSTGSMNPTENDAHKNNNNFILINSTAIANNYEDEFQEMWQGVFKKGRKVLNPAVRVGNTTLHTYFCPEDNCGQRVKEELAKAQHSIYFLAFSFTHDGIANVLLVKNQEGVLVRGVMERRGMTDDSKYGVLQYQSVEVVKDGNKNNMHHKVFIIDERVVVTGSFNPTAGGDRRNDENVLIIEDEKIAKLFVEEFWRVYGEAQKEEQEK